MNEDIVEKIEHDFLNEFNIFNDINSGGSSNKIELFLKKILYLKSFL
jgi:hypothetical protein